MKFGKLFLFATLMLGSSLDAINFKTVASNGYDNVIEFGNNLINGEGTAQKYTLCAASGCILAFGGYCLWDYNAALVCLDGHYNNKIMHKSKLVYMTYSDFIHEIDSLVSYEMVLEFINQHCTSYGMISDVKIGKLIALTHDLQVNNNKQTHGNAYQENMILENFKNNLFMVQKNRKEELINNAINANTRANNLWALHYLIEIINSLTSNNK